MAKRPLLHDVKIQPETKISQNQHQFQRSCQLQSLNQSLNYRGVIIGHIIGPNQYPGLISQIQREMAVGCWQWGVPMIIVIVIYGLVCLYMVYIARRRVREANAWVARVEQRYGLQEVQYGSEQAPYEQRNRMDEISL